MRSSISASNAAPLFHLKMMAAGGVLFVIALELLFSHPIKEYSSTYRRVSHQYVEALRSRPAKAGEPVSVLMVGNSLLLYGVDVPRLQASTSRRLRIYPIFLEYSAYYDWLYGLRRLFREGARPQVVVIGLGADSLVEDRIRTEYSPLLLLDASDVVHVSADLGLDRTAAANLLLAHSSAFWDLRRAFRAQVLRHLIPYAEDLFALLRPRRDVSLAPDAEAKAIQRLETLRSLVDEHGGQLILLIPPTPGSESGVRLATIAAQKVGVETLVPIDPVTLPASFYQDAIHLNADGATRFTSALVASLPKRISVQQRYTSPN